MIQSDYIYLLKIFRHRHLKISEIIDVLNLTNGQLNYRYNKINDWLRLNGIPVVERENGYFIFDEKTAKFIENVDIESIDLTYFEEQLRVILLAIYIVMFDGEVSRNHIMYFLNISKNTAMSDLDELRDLASGFKVDLEYDRQRGYHFCAQEVELRNFFEYLLSLTNHHEIIVKKMNQEDDQFLERYDHFKYSIDRLEHNLNYRFSDETYFRIPLYLILVNKRIEGKYLVKDIKVNIENRVKESTSYNYINLNKPMFFDEIPMDDEVLMLVVYLNSLSKTRYQFSEMSVHKQELSKRILEFIHLFEEVSAVVVLDKQVLVSKLVIHLSPVVYRNVSNTYYNDLSPFINKKMQGEFKETRYFVEQSLKPLEDYFEMKLPESEIYFLSVYMQSHLEKAIDGSTGNIRALIVCEQGIATSNILRNKLMKVFPEFFFDDVISIRRYLELEDTLNYHIVFSTSYFMPSNENKLIVVNDVDNFDVDILKTEVSKLLEDNPTYQMIKLKEEEMFISFEDILGVQLNEKDRKNLTDAIMSNTLLNSKEEEEEVLEDKTLIEFINDDHVIVIEEDQTWDQIITTLTSKIGLRNLDKDLLQLFPEPEERILFGSQIFLPHMHRYDISNFEVYIAYVKSGIKLEEHNVKFLAILLANDNHSHISTLYELHDVSMKINEYPSNLDFDNKESVIEFLKSMCGEEVVND